MSGGTVGPITFDKGVEPSTTSGAKLVESMVSSVKNRRTCCPRSIPSADANGEPPQPRNERAAVFQLTASPPTPVTSARCMLGSSALRAPSSALRPRPASSSYKGTRRLCRRAAASERAKVARRRTSSCAALPLPPMSDVPSVMTSPRIGRPMWSVLRAQQNGVQRQPDQPL